jgi:hypothetical protein
MAFELVETGLPQLLVRGEPVDEFCEWLGSEAVDAALTVGSDCHEAGLAQDAELFRNGGLAQSDTSDEFAHGLLALAQCVEDLPAGCGGEDLERRIDGHRDT